MYRANALDALDSKDPKGEAHCRERNSCMHLSAELQRIAQCIECQFRTAANYEEFHILTKSRSEPAQYEGTFDGFRVTLCPFFFAAQKGEKLTPYQQCQQYVLLKIYEDNCRRDGSNLLVQKMSPDGFNPWLLLTFTYIR